MTRGRLRIYLGAAPGVGKTVAMLDEGHRRLDRGTDVVVGLVETHDRAHTAALVGGLEVRREFSVGTLTHPRKARPPLLAALGGSSFPPGSSCCWRRHRSWAPGAS